MKPKHLIFTLLAFLTSITASAYKWTDANGTVWSFTTSGSNATITPSISGTIPTDLTIPATVYYGGSPYHVTVIEDYAFMGCSITSVTIPDGITTIWSSAFEDCYNLTSVNIPKSVTLIDDYAFSSCPNLTSINIPNGVTSIGDEVFKGCSNLNSVIIGNSVTSIGSGAFYGCSNLTSINIPDGVTSIGDEVFKGCSNLNSVIIGNSVTSIGSGAFYGCSGLTSINIPDGVTSIGDEVFKGCSNLNSVIIGNSVTSIGSDAFYGCSRLTSINIPDGVTSIGSYAFIDCTNLNSVIIGNSVTSIGSYAFKGCSNLTSVIIGNSVTSIGNSAFYGCSSLTSVNIPESVTSIESQAFKGCSNLTSVIIGNSVTSIESQAFKGCSSLTSVNIPESVTSIGSDAFSNCERLSVHFNSSTALPYSSGWDNTTIIFVPDEAVDAYKAAWPNLATRIVPESSNSLYDVTVTVTALADASGVIQEIGEENALTVVNLKVSGSINSYDVMVFRNKMLNLRHLDLSDATIVASDYTYYNNQYKTKDNVVTGYFAPSTLLSLTLPNSIVAIDYRAISDCSYLTSISIPESVTSIGSDAFWSCSRLQSVTLPSGITEIPHGAFYGCSNLKSIELPRGVTSIGNHAFYGCNGLTAINLPKGLKTIGSRTFEDCSSLTQIKLPPYVESMGDNVFSGCSMLNDISVYIPDYTLSVNETAFNTYTTAELKIPRFLYNDYYYSEGGWKRFINIVRCDLQPGDYETLPTNTDTSISGNDEIIPKIDEDTPIDGEIFDEGSITVTDDVTGTQEFDNVDQNIDGEGHGGSIIGEDDGETQGNLAVNHLRVKINVKAGRWYFFCFPFDVLINECEYPGQYAWRWYDCAARAAGNNGWTPVTATTLTAGQGYAFQTSHTGNLIITFDQPTFGGDRPKPLQAYASGNQANASWNFVGNPYSSFYDFIVNDFSAPITLYNANGTYSAYRPGDDDIHLQPYQAFFVQKPEEVASILFDADRRETYRKSEEKKANRIVARRARGINPQRRLINLEILSGEEQMDKTRVVLNDEKSHAYELDCDAAKMMSGDAKAQLYSVENGVNMAINERPQAGDIRLGYTAKAAGTLSISASRMDMPMMLVDTQLGTTFDLSLGSYDFDTAAGTFDGRFLLRPSGEATAINQLAAKTGVCIGTQDGGIAIGGAEGKTIRVFNAAGAEVGANDGNGFINLRSGIYVVSVDGVNAKVSVK